MIRRYQLTQTVNNPQADRRRRYEWAKEVQFKEGDRFEVITESRSTSKGTIMNEFLRPSNPAFFGQLIPINDPRAALIISSSNEVGANIHEAVREARDEYASATVVLERMVEDGKISLDDIRNTARSRRG